MDSRATFQRLARAAVRFDARRALAGAGIPATIAGEGDFARVIGAVLVGRVSR